MKLFLGTQEIKIEATFEERELCKSFGGLWNPEKKRWYIPIARANKELLRQHGFDDLVDVLDGKISFEDKKREIAERELEKIRKKYNFPDHPLYEKAAAQIKEGIQILDFQKQDINFVLHRLNDNKAACIFSEMGTGKTLQGIILALALDKKCLVVCPAFLKKNWEKEITKFSNEKCWLIRKKSDLINKKIVEKNTECKFIIVNYEILEACGELFENSFVIADESHALKNPESQRTMHFFKSIQKSFRVLFMTGTPMRNGIPDSFTVFSYCCENYPQDYWPYCSRYARRIEKQFNGKSVTLFEGITSNREYFEEFKAYQELFSVRRRTKEVVRLPSMYEQYVDVECESLEKAMVKLKMSLDLNETNILQALKTIGVQKFIEENKEKMSIWKRANSFSKASSCAIFALNSLSSYQESIVIFTDHPSTAREIKKHFDNDKKVSSAVICGDTSMEVRSKLVDDFQKGSLNFLIATIGAMATGVTLTRASKMIFCDICWVPSDLEQAKARIYRIGQENKCTVYYLIATELDDIITKTVVRKMNTIKTSLTNA